MKYLVFKITLACLFTINLAACGGNSASLELAKPPAPTAPENMNIEVTQASALQDSRLACYQGEARVADTCGLITYQIMVESFIDGDTNIGYTTGYGTSHHGGDLQGIIDSLDYIKNLGVNAIWLTPIFQSTAISGQTEWADRLDATGYFSSDYFNIDNNFGDMEKAKELVDTAHAKGLYVFFDGVFGHHKGNVAISPEGRKPTNGKPQGDGFQASYPADIDFYKEVATYWINELKIDGWRLDQAYQVPVSDWAELREAVESASASVTYTNMYGDSVNPLGYMVAEIWSNQNEIAAQGYGSNNSPALLSGFDFPMRYSAVQTFAMAENGIGDRAASTLNTGFMSHLAYPEHAMPNLMIGNHDLVRFGDLLQRAAISDPTDSEYWARHKAAFSFMAAYSGPITFYYGEEIGDELPGYAKQIEPCSGDSGLCDDHVARSSAKIEGITAQLNTQQVDLKGYFSKLMNLRQSNPALYNGARTHIYSDTNLYIDRKDTADNHVLYLLNAKDKSLLLTLSSSAIGSNGALTNLTTGQSHAIAGDVYTLNLAPFESLFLNIESPTTEGPQTGQSNAIIGEGFMGACDNPNAIQTDPLIKPIYIRGTYQGGNNFEATPASRQFSYKGQNTYQVVVNEVTATAYSFKFADSDWSTEMAIAGSAAVLLGQEQDAVIASGHGSESSIAINQPGDYVFSFTLNKDRTPNKLMVSKCAKSY
ncbi:alpha-amylase family glycosyl hydrolase [Psychromonas hadalis]|uniref:alpha-amylase family glycosyl hydrolase n=1 Tax=Psychromonas hadalis TaxID=211669 RepID=UPI0003B2F1E8|nr:alpha-amylase family glycosyl hydrolase [Psychromonas hadalis]